MTSLEELDAFTEDLKKRLSNNGNVTTFKPQIGISKMKIAQHGQPYDKKDTTDTTFKPQIGISRMKIAQHGQPYDKKDTTDNSHPPK